MRCYPGAYISSHVFDDVQGLYPVAVTSGGGGCGSLVVTPLLSTIIFHYYITLASLYFIVKHCLNFKA